MNILIVSALQIHPPESGGQSRTASLAAVFADAGHDVRIHSLIGRRAGYTALKGAHDITVSPRVHEHVAQNYPLGAIGIGAYRIGLPPLWAHVGLKRFPWSKRLTSDMAWSNVVIADFPFVTPVWRRAKGKLLVLSTHNVEQTLFKDQPLVSLPVARLERQAALGAEVIICCCNSDAAFFRGVAPDKPVVVVPNGVDARRFAENRTERMRMRKMLAIPDHTKAVLFSASAYGPNVRGFDFLESFAAAHATELESLGLVFLVAGSVARTPGRFPGLIATGKVDRIEPYFAAADFAVNPLFEGSGTSVKLAEYMAAGLPVLSTAIGARGFRFNDGIHGKVFEDAAGLLAALKATGESALDWTAMASRAHADNADMIDMRTAAVPLLTLLAERAGARS